MQELHEEILAQLKIQDEKQDSLAKCVAVLNERITHHCSVEHKDFDTLLDVVRQGKALSKVIGVIIAAIAGLAATYDWIVTHLRLH